MRTASKKWVHCTAWMRIHMIQNFWNTEGRLPSSDIFQDQLYSQSARMENYSYSSVLLPDGGMNGGHSQVYGNDNLDGSQESQYWKNVFDLCKTPSGVGSKVIIVGSFLCDPAESSWACMFGKTEVPIETIHEGVICCKAPPHLPGKVTLCITTANREPCSEIREFEYKDGTSSCTRCNLSHTEAAKSVEELLLSDLLRCFCLIHHCTT
ncbi:hypothetical protein F3Y22_tig00117056pilonHSYRG00080 [Hibiscus syriacus]|uniref:IPT/TIG domain-containing protein n=1 Tax=Hibiscus syriacus TaxID=106335 RepID=A0A6A2WA54_HIBSY|nr:hypothetical protein F3Y22_tig00117056pilonHSYRG00080 [Hibiscus syriacus]